MFLGSAPLSVSPAMRKKTKCTAFNVPCHQFKSAVENQSSKGTISVARTKIRPLAMMQTLAWEKCSAWQYRSTKQYVYVGLHNPCAAANH